MILQTCAQAKCKDSDRLHIRAILSESLLGEVWRAKIAKFLHAIIEDSDQTARMHRFEFLLDAPASRYVF